MRYVIRFPATKNEDWVPMYWTNFANSLGSPLVTAIPIMIWGAPGPGILVVEQVLGTVERAGELSGEKVVELGGHRASADFGGPGLGAGVVVQHCHRDGAQLLGHLGGDGVIPHVHELEQGDRGRIPSRNVTTSSSIRVNPRRFLMAAPVLDFSETVAENRVIESDDRSTSSDSPTCAKRRNSCCGSAS